jgi:hypothetical protein
VVFLFLPLKKGGQEGFKILPNPPFTKEGRILIYLHYTIKNQVKKAVFRRSYQALTSPIIYDII